jgi:hypothetical protein
MATETSTLITHLGLKTASRIPNLFGQSYYLSQKIKKDVDKNPRKYGEENI